MMTVSNKPLSASHPYIDSMQEHQRCLPLSESKQVCTGESRVFPQHHLTELHRSLQLRGLPAGIRAQCTGAWASSPGFPTRVGSGSTSKRRPTCRSSTQSWGTRGDRGRRDARNPDPDSRSASHKLEPVAPKSKKLCPEMAH